MGWLIDSGCGQCRCYVISEGLGVTGQNRSGTCSLRDPVTVSLDLFFFLYPERHVWSSWSGADRWFSRFMPAEVPPRLANRSWASSPSQGLARASGSGCGTCSGFGPEGHARWVTSWVGGQMRPVRPFMDTHRLTLCDQACPATLQIHPGLMPSMGQVEPFWPEKEMENNTSQQQAEVLAERLAYIGSLVNT